MALLPADYVLLGLTLVTAVMGMFRGFSGTLAFFLACGGAAATGVVVWPISAAFIAQPVLRGGAVLLAVLLAFGLVRLLVKKIVNGLLAQPADAFFGFLVGAGFGVAALFGWALVGQYLEYSFLAQEVATYVR